MTSNAPKMNLHADLEQQFVKLIESNQLEVPMLPEVARKAVQLAEDPNGDSSTMAKLIQSDQTLAAQVMRIANSSFYNPTGAAMVSLQQAITRLGMKRMAEIALAASLHAKLFNAPGYEAHVLDLLKHALAAGLWAKEIARSARKNVEAAFLGGLLHDIGRPVVLQAVVELARLNAIELSREETYGFEEKYQRRVGARVVNLWKMPSMVCDVVEHFDNYQDLSNSNQLQVMIATAGALFADNLTEEPANEEKHNLILKSTLMAELNFYHSDIEELLAKASEMQASLGVLMT